jgi:hypothetical protein
MDPVPEFDPDPLVKGTDPRIRISTKMSQIVRYPTQIQAMRNRTILSHKDDRSIP